jgi:type IV pilus assembly protein PilN
MIRLNLLPWREEEKAYRQKRFLIIVGVSFFIAVSLSSLWVYLLTLVEDNHVYRNEMIKREIVVLDAKINEIKKLEDHKLKLLARMSVIEKLQDSRPEVVKIFNVIANEVPKGVYLVDIVRADEVITINGISESNSRISAFMKNLDAIEWLSDSTLSIVEEKSSEEENAVNTLRQFTVQVSNKNNGDALEEGNE